MRLLLDEMISPRIARALRGQGLDVAAIKADRPEWEALADVEVLRRASGERRALVTNDVLDFRPIHDRMLLAGERHHGLLFTDDATMPRNKAAVPLWVATLGRYLRANPAEEALRARIAFLP